MQRMTGKEDTPDSGRAACSRIAEWNDGLGGHPRRFLVVVVAPRIPERRPCPAAQRYRTGFAEGRSRGLLELAAQHFELSREPAVVDGDGCCTIRCTELLENARQMDLDRAFADAERARD